MTSIANQGWHGLHPNFILKASECSGYNGRVQWIYLSPHLDDGALSCGGMIWDQTSSGEAVTILTICAGDPPPGPLSPFASSLHSRWETGEEAVARRREEDLAACSRLSATPRHLELPDCIYRRSPKTGETLYDSEASLGNAIHPHELPLVTALSEQFAALPEGAQLVSPLAIGRHVDHRLVRAAAERSGRALLYYADYPYILQDSAALEALLRSGWKPVGFPLPDTSLEAWQEAVATYQSQISSFWSGKDEMRRAIEDYAASRWGLSLWRRPI